MITGLTRRSFLTIAGGATAVGAISILGRSAGQDVLAQDDATPGAEGSPEAMMGGGSAAAFMQIANTGTADDRLIGGSTDVADAVEIHEMKLQGDVMMMSPLADGLVIPAGGSVTLEPGGYHVMIIGLRKDLKPGETYELTLKFETAGEVKLTVPIYATDGMFERANAESPADPIVVGTLSLTGIWTRMAPMLVEGSPAAMPGGSPEATPGM